MKKEGFVPTREFTKSTGWLIWILKMPCALSRTRPSSLSLKATGSLVPHLRLVKTFMFTKYISALMGLVKPQGRERSFVSMGMFKVEIVCLPGPKASQATPWE